MKRYIKASEMQTSSLSFDFSYYKYSGYVEDAIIDAVDRALRDNGCEIRSYEFRSVEYSPSQLDLDKFDASQFGCDFVYMQHYDQAEIEKDISRNIYDLEDTECLDVLGMEFYSTP